MSSLIAQCLLAASGGAVTDPFFAQVALLLHMEGTEGGALFPDSSSNGFTPASVTTNTTTATQFKFGLRSMNCASGGGVRFADDADFSLGTGDFTIEAFVRFNDTGASRWIAAQCDSSSSNTSLSFAIERTSGNKIEASCCSGSSSIGLVTSSSSVTSGVWYYVAYCRDGTTFRLFIDAVAEGTATSSSSVNDSANQLAIGNLGERNLNAMIGWIDEFRLTVGVYRDIASLGVPTAAFPNS
jgi:hypothetical protein